MEGGSPSITESWCVTDAAKVIKCRFEWTINNFSLCVTKDLYSSSFSADDDENECKWRLCFKVNKTQTHYFALYIQLVSLNESKSEVPGNCKFAIIDSKGNEMYVKGQDTPVKFQKDVDTGYYNFILTNDLFQNKDYLLPNNKLTILCEVSMVSDLINTSGQTNVNFKVPACRLPEDLGDLLNSEKFSDITLAVGDKEFKAHKAILSARSPVFAAMFEHNMEEQRNNRVNITDVDHETLRELLLFIYTGRAANVDKMANSLLSASDKYTLERLKVLCEAALYKGVSVENATDSLILADLHSADQLKAAILNFINKNHARDVMDTSG